MNFQYKKKSCKGHQRSNMQWLYIHKIMSQGVPLIWKVLQLYQKVHNYLTMLLY